VLLHAWKHCQRELFSDQELISYRYHLVLVGRPPSKNIWLGRFRLDWDESKQDCSFIDCWSRILDLTSQFQHGGHDVVSCRKVPPSDECPRRVCTAHMPQRP